MSSIKIVVEKKLSIIIPVYNTELYVDKCLRSCAEQDILPEDYEIIVINDGSTDTSLKIVNGLAAEYTNLIVIDKPNGGVSSARNTGLDIAEGKYVWFIDADDWIEKNCLAILLDTIVRNTLDALQINAKRVDNTGFVTPYHPDLFKDSPVLPTKDYVDGGFFEGYAWMTIFRREIVKEQNIRFNSEFKMSEDLLFSLELISHIKRIQRINIDPYYYCERNFSASILFIDKSRIPLLIEIRIFKSHYILREYIEWLICETILTHIEKNINNIPQLVNELDNNGYKKVKVSKITKLKVRTFFFFYNINFKIAIYFLYMTKYLQKKL